jgi:hypothetical protein
MSHGLTIFNQGCDEYSALDRARSLRGRISSSMMVDRIDTLAVLGDFAQTLGTRGSNGGSRSLAGLDG